MLLWKLLKAQFMSLYERYILVNVQAVCEQAQVKWVAGHNTTNQLSFNIPRSQLIPSQPGQQPSVLVGTKLKYNFAFWMTDTA